ncbi:MAG: alpha/beta hydrolase [Bryobacteraceae bacterium]|nr:alpha/beta hydrolase [Bryobacteraceae bacterium]
MLPGNTRKTDCGANRSSLRWVVRAAPFALLCAAVVFAQPEKEFLWPSGAPGALGDADGDKPTLSFYVVPAGKASGTGVIVCPGGGYGGLAMDHEGVQIAQFLNNLGISAFVLKYRLGPKYHHPSELMDAQRAIRLVRSRAKEFNLATDRIGIWGFSAGGHLASTAATHFDAGKPDATEAMERLSSRPDFAVLAYPVITFTEEQYVHKGSRKNLLGDNPDPKLVEYLSTERHVTSQTPPVFLFHTDGDTGVPPENSVLFYMALRKAKVPAELHIFEKGKHGVGLAPSDPILSSWSGRLTDWFRTRGLLTAR